MEIRNFELHVGRIVEYLVQSYQYQIVHVKQATTDVWLVNAKHKQYPVICVNAFEGDIIEKQFYFRQVHRTILDVIHKEGNLLILNTNPTSTPIQNAYLQQICVNQQGVSDINILKDFPNLGQLYKESDDLEKEFVRLTRVIEEEQMKNRRQFIQETKKRLRPNITYGIMLIFVIAFIIGYISSIVVEDSVTGWILAGIYYKMNIIAAHEYWRLFTAGFIHANMFSLFFSLYAIYKIGKICEPILSKTMFLSLFLIGIFVGNISMLISVENTIGYGAGAGICSIAGAYIAMVMEEKKYHHPFIKIMLIQIAWILFVLILMPGISIFAHVIGFVSGFFISIGFMKSKRWYRMRRHMQVSFMILVLGLIILGLRVRYIAPLEPVFDERIVESYRVLGIDKYADYLQSAYQKQYLLQE